MLTFPNAKINLGLRILRKRPDGFHDIDSCFYPVGWKDALEIQKAASKVAFQSTGIAIDGEPENNLCIKAYQLLANDYDLPPVRMHLHKNIPIGAGLGGGSADCAYAISMLNDLFELKLSATKMQAYAAVLGSDCPFFIENEPMLVSGRGEVLNAFDFSLQGKYIMLVYPELHIATKEAYEGIKPSIPSKSCQEILNLPMSQWKGLLKNDFEESIFPKYPQLARLKTEIYHLGAVYASMTGSGSTIFGIFDEYPRKLHTWPEGYQVHVGAC